MSTHVASLDRATKMDHEAFEKAYLGRSEPVLVEQDPDVVDLAHRWTIDYLVDADGDHMLEAEHYPDGDRSGRWTYRRLTLREYVGLVRSGPESANYYVAEAPVGSVVPSAASDVRVPVFIRAPAQSVIFMGVDTFSSMHYHPAPMEALLTQVVGRKRVLLVPAREFERMYPGPISSMGWNWSRLPWSQVPSATTDGLGAWLAGGALERYPMARAATVYDVELASGQSLFIPQGWYHAVQGIGESLSVTHFFKGSLGNGVPRQVARDLVALAHKRFVVRPLINIGARLRGGRPAMRPLSWPW